jgi:ribosomal protein S18 acetylase RimI-like enzyme
MTFQKQYARRSLDGYTSPYDDPFEYRTVLDVGEEAVMRLMIPFVEDKTNSDRMAQARIEWEGYIVAEITRYQPENWLVAFNAEVPVGVVFPTRYLDQPEEGSISFIGVFPEWQGRGYGKILHAKGLEALASMGVTRYVGSTEVSNALMLATFLANGCEFTKIRTIQVDELGRHKPID